MLKDKYLQKPPTSDWLNISEEFERVWNFPHCIGALDGKHIRVKCPNNSGTEFFNYKKYFGIVLMAVCDGAYKFTLVDIGAFGSANDGAVFQNSKFGNKFDLNEMSVPG